MKKFFTIILAFAIVCSMRVPVFAAEGNDNGNTSGESHSIDVTAKTSDKNVNEIPVYSVDISWDSMTFTYSESGTKVWDASTHTYSTNTEGGWDKTTADIVVTNHSNAPVDVSVVYSGLENSGVSAAIINGTDTLDAGVENAYDKADKLVATLKISGKPSNSVTSEGVKIGSITITIS